MKTHEIPPELVDLELYAVDEKLCARWPKLFAAWKVAYPGLDIVAEVKRAHAWEVANPKRRKKDRARFIGNWLQRQQDRGWRRPMNAERRTRELPSQKGKELGYL